jgi:lysophospholipase L1-like esterase
MSGRIPLWAASLSTSQSPIFIVDQHTGFEDDDFRDGVHPNEAGDRKIAAKFYPVLLEAIRSIQPPSDSKAGQVPLGVEL